MKDVIILDKIRKDKTLSEIIIDITVLMEMA